ncbi:MAG: zinc metalloprotease HtpX [Candidatus Harrisonbacteria bacterium]|nr:zinc metalloprotease HtpX [Candidatus Harrisonbacteria bacterium]
MAASLYKEQDRNVLKTWFFMALYVALFLILGWALSGYYGNTQILFIAVGFSLVMNFFAYFYSDKLALASAGAVEASREKYERLHETVENLAITAGLPKPRIYIINDPAPNAFATGRDKNHAAVAVTTGILQRLDRVELEGVLAHELAHIGNRDILLSSIVVVLVGVVSFIADIFLRNMFFRGNDDDHKGGALLLLLQVALIVIAPIVATLIQLAISRRREFLADATGALLTRYPEGLASALQKIAEDHHPLRRASMATAHLFISNPLKDRRAANFLARIFSTHPPTSERVRRLLGK